LRASTKRNYEDALRPVRERLGTRPLQSITKSDVEDLVDWMLTAGRRRGGKPGTGLSGRSARLTPVRRRTGGGCPGRQARPQRGTACPTARAHPRERETWSKAEVRKFLAKASSDRLHVAWRLSLYGLRRGEVLGLRWSDIDLRAGMLTVNQARVLVEYRIRIEEPKSRNGKRTLPLDSELVAGLRRITLHDSRHTTLTLMEHAGVPISIISKWAGHYDSAFTQKTYVHASEDDLQRGQAALARIHKIA
jgi:integrase